MRLEQEGEDEVMGYNPQDLAIILYLTVIPKMNSTIEEENSNYLSSIVMN